MTTTERPAYRILSAHGFFADNDSLYTEGSTIYWEDEPNEEMEPLNEAAKQQMTVYLDKLDSLAKEAAAKRGVAFTGRPRTLDQALSLARQNEELKFKVRGAEKDSFKVDDYEPADIPEVGNVKRKPGRPKYKNIEIV